jgi:dipeptidyl aminopeptidase/acylaminoacyl peptidase
MEEKIFFKDSKGNRLCGILSDPTGDNGRPIIILCHGFRTSKNRRTYLRLQEMLNKRQISTFRFDFFGHGESDDKFEDITISEAVDDTLIALKFLKDRGYGKIGLFGSSFGGIVSLMVASKTSDLFVLALKSPVSNYLELESEKRSRKEMTAWKKDGFTLYKDGDGKKYRLKFSFFEDFKDNDGYEAAKKIKIPVLIVHGDKDVSVPLKQSKKTARIIKDCTLKVIKGADHKYARPEHFQKMLDLISAFIEKNI